MEIQSIEEQGKLKVLSGMSGKYKLPGQVRKEQE